MLPISIRNIYDYDSVPSWAPVCLFGVCAFSVRNAERLGG